MPKVSLPKSAAIAVLPPTEAVPKTDTLPMVGIGASAGGLEAFSQLLANLPDSTGMGFVLIQHLDPGHDSHLAELLSRTTSMPVSEAVDGQVILANSVYVIPPGVSIALDNGALRLTPRGDKRGLHLPIDIFFRSLADHASGKMIGVILSGTGTDGTQGMEEIKAAGGITFAQDPGSAGFQGMPQTAIDAGLADYILSPADIAKELARLSRKEFFLVPGPEASKGQATAGAESQAYTAVLELLRTRMNVDFTQYRDSTLKRRIERRMLLSRQDSVAAYAELMQKDERELKAIYHDVLINVTRFFRDAEVFESLKHTVFPEIVKEKSADLPIRVWVTGCSSGQEAYTLAILLVEYLAEMPRPPPFQIFASDLKEAGALERARLGFYPESIEADVSPERLQRFFTREDHGYRIRKELRDACIFAKHDLVADPPFSRVDLVTCRNVLIYMSPALQRKVIPIFHYALNPGGYLLLGSSETIGRDSDLFKVVDRDHKLYRRNAANTRAPNFMVKAPVPGALSPALLAGNAPVSHSDFRREADRILLNRFPPACVLVNAELEILQFRGRTSPFLEPPQGAASFNLLRMANESLFLDLRAAVAEAQEASTVVRRKHVRVRDGDGARTIDLEVIPVALPVTKQICFLILFLEEAEEAPTEGNANAKDSDRPAPEAQDSIELGQLRRETASLRDYLQSLREQHETAIEELRTSNEEMLSANEELQSTNEELETGKEEYQSANEELTTVNEEMALRHVEMGTLSNDVNNLLNSINIPVVIVGGDLRIRRFTVAAGRALHLIPADVGRPLGDLQWDFTEPDLGKVVLEVAASGNPQDHEVRNREGRWQSLRVHPYKTSDNRMDGAVIILMDIDVLKTFQDKLQYAEEYASSIVATVREPLLILRDDLRINTANASFYKMFATTPQESEGKPLFRPGSGIWNFPGLRRLVEDCILREEAFDEFEMTFDDPVTGMRNILLNGRALLREKGKARMILLSMEDITERKRAQDILANQSIILEKAVKERTAELQASNEEMEVFSYSVSHDLRAPLRAMRGYAEALLNDFGEQADSKSKDYINKIIQSGAKMDKLILAVLTYSRTALSEVRIHRVDLDALVKEAVHLHPDLQAPAVELEVVGPLASVIGHEAALGQCISNLLLNAVKFVPAGKVPVIRVRTETLGPDVRLWVEDNGIGVAPEHHERIFGMFEKLNAGETYGGTGIGLAIVKKSMERMGGKAGIESEKGKGSRFWLQLPNGDAL
jgi:two-component system CheB/CheR fusion protein